MNEPISTTCRDLCALQTNLKTHTRHETDFVFASDDEEQFSSSPFNSVGVVSYITHNAVLPPHIASVYRQTMQRHFNTLLSPELQFSHEHDLHLVHRSPAEPSLSRSSVSCHRVAFWEFRTAGFSLI